MTKTRVILKYPNCEICKALRETFSESDLSNQQINDYHESKIIWGEVERRIGALQNDIIQIVIDFTKEKGEV